MKNVTIHTLRAAVASAALACTLSATGIIDQSSGFTNHSGLQANGSASFANGKAVLTDGGGGEAGSIFSVTPVMIQNFTSTFTFSIVPAAGLADGMAFCIQGNGPSALGIAGEYPGLWWNTEQRPGEVRRLR